jgi:hypothetical protein
VRITRTTTGGTSYAASFSAQPSLETLAALDAVADAAVQMVLEEKGGAWASPQEPPASPADSGRLEMNPTHLPTRGDHGRPRDGNPPRDAE